MAISAGTAIGSAWEAQLESMLSRLSGVAAGEAIEDLHKFRVELRNTRALLKIFQKIVPGTESFIEEFKWLARETGNVRDLDMALQFSHSQANEQATPTELQALTAVLLQLQSERDSAQAQLTSVIDSSRCRKLFFDWRQFIAALPEKPDLAWGAHIKASTLLVPITIKQCRRLLLAGRKTDAHTAASNLHRLRIRGKRLRYLLESFSTVLKKKKIKSLRKRLIKLQDLLGKHQDSFSSAGRWQDMIDQYEKPVGFARAANSEQQGADRRSSLKILKNWLDVAEAQQLEARAQLQDLLADFARSCRKL